MAAVALEIVDKDHGNDRAALIVLNPAPRRDVLIAPQRRPAASAAIAKDVTKVADRTPHMDPPLILELGVHVRIRGSIGGQAPARPILPPVEIPKRALEDRGGLLPVEGAPIVPSLLIGSKQNAEIVDLEPRRAALVAR